MASNESNAPTKKNEHVSVKKMKRMDHVQSFELFPEYCAC